jgi:hypothetical protein
MHTKFCICYEYANFIAPGQPTHSTICQLGNLSWLNKPSHYVNIDMRWETVMWEHIRNIWTLEGTSTGK